MGINALGLFFFDFSSVSRFQGVGVLIFLHSNLLLWSSLRSLPHTHRERQIFNQDDCPPFFFFFSSRLYSSGSKTSELNNKKTDVWHPYLRFYCKICFKGTSWYGCHLCNSWHAPHYHLYKLKTYLLIVLKSTFV